jgi:hypothetical protein
LDKKGEKIVGPIFTQRHFKRLASMLIAKKPNPYFTPRVSKYAVKLRAWDDFADSIISMCALDNPKFNRDKFEKAIGRKY